MAIKDYQNYVDLDFESFRKRATDEALSKYEKIGFPDSYRANFESKIFDDIKHKLTNLSLDKKIVMDIGPGCSELPLKLIELCRIKNHFLILVDSQEMLNHLPNESFILKIPARYPYQCEDIFQKYSEQVDVILCYSVLQIIFFEDNIFKFLDKSLTILSPGGQMLIGDIPNISKRKRFFSSPAGIKYHQQFTNTEQKPIVKYNIINENFIDDSVLFSMMMRCRNFGFDAYLLPQAKDLPMANRREDFLIERP
jgi:hypothetical protein